MGGKAFSATLPATSFPRIPPAIYYRHLKPRTTPKIKTLYSIVSTPAEAPLKASHGDLDLLVCEPLNSAEVSPAEVQTLLGARFMVPEPGNRTSSYAVLIEPGEWRALGHDAEENAARLAAEAAGQPEIYYQVDVHVCADKAEWERIHFFHGNGDTGMILGLLARNNGLTLGTKGLKARCSTSSNLSESMDEIMEYMGLSMERCRAGFSTTLEIFEWLGSSSFFNPLTFRSQGRGIKKVKSDRTMYAEFTEWAGNQEPKVGGAMSREARIQHALVRFGKKGEYDRLLKEDADRALLKNSFNGHKVQEWTGIKAWSSLHTMMEAVRTELGGNEGIVALLNVEGEDGIREVVLRAKERLLGVTEG
ncbi:hypothetical protein MIND_00248500 [Mycena indigotica]|uniref:Uncharacterized protein n=1 Tax=Mycena indigotica TaxID=2126181 RepID=A0A8H6WHD2_9AGAR|nr:uncharacterized protein MIND_00248500 [Mycena indigotica]KAF7312354.1 hypothetical protein MIND_00248500 [Mycena indigotica]